MSWNEPTGSGMILILDDIWYRYLCSTYLGVELSNSMLAIGCDHAGYSLKRSLMDSLSSGPYEFVDLGSHSEDPVDYPDIASKMGELFTKGQVVTGILVCGSGIGISIAANRFKSIRAALVHDRAAAISARQHNDANVIVFGGRVIDEGLAIECLKIFLKTEFEGGRHQARVLKLS